MIDAQLRAIPKIEFDEESHVYMLGGMKLPSVTQIMEPMSLMLYSGVPEDALQNAADRGTRAHEQVSNFVKYGIVESDEDIRMLRKMPSTIAHGTSTMHCATSAHGTKIPRAVGASAMTSRIPTAASLSQM